VERVDGGMYTIDGSEPLRIAMFRDVSFQNEFVLCVMLCIVHVLCVLFTHIILRFKV
jgi:hypothetical protein